jgi:hypothetical protein
MLKSLPCVALAFFLIACTQSHRTAPAPTITVAQYAVHELTFTTDAAFKNPFWDPTVTATFTSPTGQKIPVEGFYYAGNEWRIRFVPRQQGVWSYTATMKGSPTSGQPVMLTQSGQFRCQGKTGHGFLRPSTSNPYRLQYEDGHPFYAVGIQTTSSINQADLDGPEAGQGWRTVPTAEWTDAFKGAANLVRIQIKSGNSRGMGVPLIPAETVGRQNNPNPKYRDVLIEGVPDRYDLTVAAALDRTYQLHRAAGMSQIATLLQDMSAFGKMQTAFGESHDTLNYKNVNAKTRPLQEKYIRYVIARWGCYIDIWEMFNEDSWASDEYLTWLHGFIRAHDPYKHPISTNFSRYDKPYCELILPHEYLAIPANDVDVFLSKQIAAMKSYGKPIQYTEFGNKSSFSNYDPVKWRIALWAAYMNEVGILYWSMSGNKTVAKPGGTANANTYIGADTREHFRIFHRLVEGLPQDMRPRFSHPNWLDFRSYVLGNDYFTIVYLHHFPDHATPYTIPGNVTEGIQIDTGPGQFRCTWYDPATGKTMAETRTIVTRQRLSLIPVPTFAVDAVCRVERIGPPPPPATAPATPEAVTP